MPAEADIEDVEEEEMPQHDLEMLVGQIIRDRIRGAELLFVTKRVILMTRMIAQISKNTRKIKKYPPTPPPGPGPGPGPRVVVVWVGISLFLHAVSHILATHPRFCTIES